MEAKGSLLCSQEPTNGPYTEPDAYSPLPSALLCPFLFNWLLQSLSDLGLP
jgi:hypothetical protein